MRGDNGENVTSAAILYGFVNGTLPEGYVFDEDGAVVLENA